MLRGIGRCPGLFWVAIALDLAGLSLLLVGIFGNVQVKSRGVGDCFIYSGAIIVFLSLIWWLSWCTGNIEVSMEELEGNGLAKLASKFSERQLLSPAEGEKGLGELSMANPWDVARLHGEVAPQRQQEVRYVELNRVRPPRLSSMNLQRGERLV
ncbi:transmembrane protein 238 like isoform X2 [Rhinoraja longicauda]